MSPKRKEQDLNQSESVFVRSQTESIHSGLYYIFRIGNFEARILWRSWLFRVFSVLILAILVFFDLFGVLGLAGSNAWAGRYLPGNIAYMNFFLFTVAQVIIAAFLSADFLGRERKMDTTEVFYTRPMSNLQYVLGKTWGALMVFLGLNVVVMILAMVVSFLSPDTVFAITPFFFYLFIYSLPSLVFILGFSFVLMVIVRNQAVTFVLVLGFGATVLFYLQNMHWGVWDFMGFYLPAHYSGFTGFSNFAGILMQRSVFLLLGILGILLTAFFLPRLPGRKNRSVFLIFSSVIVLLGAGFLLHSIISTGLNGQTRRTNIRHQEDALPVLPTFRIDSCHVNVIHRDHQLECEAILKISRQQKTDSLPIALNSGFKVDEVFVNGVQVEFRQHQELLYVDVVNGTERMDSLLQCRIKYHGAPDQQTIYPYVDEEDRQMLSRFDPLVAAKEHAFVQSGFVLLTREAGWYPVVAWKNYRQQPAFSAYSMNFSSKSDLQVFSQGISQSDDKETVFENDYPLNALTLVAGPYKNDSLMVDGVDYHFGVHENNLLIQNNFDQIGDTLPSLIRDLKRQYERNLKLDYPFNRLKIVEVPIHFFTYLQPWSSGTDHIQPEFILLPEYGGGKWFLDVHRTRSDFEDEAEQQGKEPQQQEIQARMFVTLVGNALLFPRWYVFEFGQETERNLDGWTRIQVFPLYFNHAFQIQEEGLPVFQIMLEEAFRNKARKGDVDSWRSDQDQYMGLLALKRKSLSQWLDREFLDDTIARILNLRGIQFFSEISALSETGDFAEEIKEPLSKDKFRESRPAEWLNNVDVSFDLHEKYREILKGSELPAFRFDGVRTSELIYDGKNQYLVSLEVSNEGGVDGILDTRTTFLNLSENRNRSFSQWMYQNVEDEQNDEKRLYLIPAREKVRIDMIFDQLPRELKVFTGAARNIPPVYTFPLENFGNEVRQLTVGGIHFLDSVAENPGSLVEIIVDNEDSGFSIDSRDEVRTLKDWWLKRESEQVEEYAFFRHWNPEPVWTTSLGDNYYGDFLRSAVLKAAGNGDDKARWKCHLPEAGSYEMQVYIPPNLHSDWRHRNEKGGFHYRIFHAGGSDKAETPPVRDRNGWVSLGRYFFDQGEAVVELSDNTNFPYVVADAVKWVKMK